MFHPNQVHHDVSRLLEPLFEEFFRPVSSSPVRRGVRRASTWEPVDDSWRTRWLVPGVSPDALEVTIEERVVSIKIPAPSNEQEGMKRHRIERSHQPRQMQLTLPSQADPATLSARAEHGVLELTVEASEAAKRRQIAVVTGGAAAS